MKGWLCAIGLFMAATGANARDIPIRNDEGGVVGTYLRRIQRSIARGDRPVLSGGVYSAATMWAGSPYACAKPGTFLGFHHLSDLVPQSLENQQLADNIYVAAHPPGIQNWIIRNRAIENPNTRIMYYLETPELWNYVPRC